MKSKANRICKVSRNEAHSQFQFKNEIKIISRNTRINGRQRRKQQNGRIKAKEFKTIPRKPPNNCNSFSINRLMIENRKKKKKKKNHICSSIWLNKLNNILNQFSGGQTSARARVNKRISEKFARSEGVTHCTMSITRRMYYVKRSMRIVVFFSVELARHNRAIHLQPKP